MYRESFEAGIDAYRRSEMKASGLELPDAGEAVTLEEMEREVLREVSEYVRRYFPEVAGLLDTPQPD